MCGTSRRFRRRRIVVDRCRGCPTVPESPQRPGQHAVAMSPTTRGRRHRRVGPRESVVVAEAAWTAQVGARSAMSWCRSASTWSCHPGSSSVPRERVGRRRRPSCRSWTSSRCRRCSPAFGACITDIVAGSRGVRRGDWTCGQIDIAVWRWRQHRSRFATSKTSSPLEYPAARRGDLRTSRRPD